MPFDDEFTVLLFEFKAGVAEYLATVSHTPMRHTCRLSQFNLEQCDAELRYFGQEVFEAAEATSGDLTDPEYLAGGADQPQAFRAATPSTACLLKDSTQWSAPSFSFGTSPAATGGYPSMAVPVGFTSSGGPVGFWMSASFLQEPGAWYRAWLGDRTSAAGLPVVHPELAGDVPPEPPRFPAVRTPLCRRPRSLPKSIESTSACARPRDEKSFAGDCATELGVGVSRQMWMSPRQPHRGCVLSVQAFADLYRSEYTDDGSRSWLIVGSPMVAEDLVQEHVRPRREAL